jgi:hypothetical protein
VLVVATLLYLTAYRVRSRAPVAPAPPVVAS